MIDAGISAPRPKADQRLERMRAPIHVQRRDRRTAGRDGKLREAAVRRRLGRVLLESQKSPLVRFVGSGYGEVAGLPDGRL